MSTTIAPGARVSPAPTPVAAPSRSAASAASRRFTAVVHTNLDDARSSWATLEVEGLCTAYQRMAWAEGMVADLMPARHATPLIVEVRDGVGGRPVMLLPMARCRRFGHTVLTWLDLGVSDYAAPLLARGFAPSADEAAAAWAAVRAALPRTDLIQIERIPPSIGTAPNPLALLPNLHVSPLQAHGLVLEGPAGTLLKRVCRPSVRQKFRKLERRRAGEGEVRFAVADTPDHVDAIFTALLDQRRQRFRDLGRFDLLDREEVRRFYKTQAHAGLSGGPARVFGLSVGGVWIATALGLVHEGTFSLILLAMDRAWREVSPGIRILAEIMMWSREQEIDTFDLSVGDLPYKAEFGARPRPLYDLGLATSPRGAAVLLARRSLTAAKTRLQAQPKLFDLLRRGRQALRRTWARSAS